MFSSITAATLLAALAPQALASLYITSPVASTVCQAGTSCPVTWNDDGTQPTLAMIGACTVGLYVGDQFTQYQLQPLGDVDVATQASATFIPNASVGGPSDLYFLRFTATTYTVNGGIPWEGFSAKFTINGMTGTFNASESSLMYAPTTTLGGGTSAAASTPATSAAATTPNASQTVGTTTTKPASSSTGSKAASSPTTSKSAALPVIAGSSSSIVAGVAAVAVSAFLAAFAV
jgi:hypothetical protein